MHIFDLRRVAIAAIPWLQQFIHQQTPGWFLHAVETWEKRRELSTFYLVQGCHCCLAHGCNHFFLSTNKHTRIWLLVSGVCVVVNTVNFTFCRVAIAALTVEKTSSASCSTEIFVHPNFLKTLTLVGLCTVADGCVRNRVRKRFLSGRGGGAGAGGGAGGRGAGQEGKGRKGTRRRNIKMTFRMARRHLIFFIIMFCCSFIFFFSTCASSKRENKKVCCT